MLNLCVLLSWLAGDFKRLHFEVFGSDTNITVTEVTKGRGDMKTFTLLWGGIPTKPIAFNASKSEVCIVKKKKKSPVTVSSLAEIFLSYCSQTD